VRAALNQQTRINVQIMGNAWAQLRIANAQIQAADQQISAAQLAFEGVREEASLGARTTLDVLDAEQDVLDARISRIEAQTSLYSAAYSILAAGGLLTVEHLDLDVPGYDPAPIPTSSPVRPAGYRARRATASTVSWNVSGATERRHLRFAAGTIRA
jgi:outer membrane protein